MLITVSSGPHGPKFSQFHAVLSQNLAKSYVGAPSPPPTPGGLAPPPTGSPESDPGKVVGLSQKRPVSCKASDKEKIVCHI